MKYSELGILLHVFPENWYFEYLTFKETSLDRGRDLRQASRNCAGHLDGWNCNNRKYCIQNSDNNHNLCFSNPKWFIDNNKNSTELTNNLFLITLNIVPTCSCYRLDLGFKSNFFNTANNVLMKYSKIWLSILDFYR